MRYLVLLLLLLSFSYGSEKFQNNKVKRCNEKFINGVMSLKEGEYNKALATLTTVKTTCIGGLNNLDSLYFYIGECYLKTKKYNQAKLEYEEVVDRYPKSALREEASYKLGYCNLMGAPIIQRDDKSLKAAQTQLMFFVNSYPGSQYADSAQVLLDTIYERLVSKDLHNAEFYEIVEKYESAIIYYESILENFPKTSRVDTINLSIAKNLILSNRFSEAQLYMERLTAKDVLGLEIKELEALTHRRKELLAAPEKKKKRKK